METSPDHVRRRRMSKAARAFARPSGPFVLGADKRSVQMAAMSSALAAALGPYVPRKVNTAATMTAGPSFVLGAGSSENTNTAAAAAAASAPPGGPSFVLGAGSSEKTNTAAAAASAPPGGTFVFGAGTLGRANTAATTASAPPAEPFVFGANAPQPAPQFIAPRPQQPVVQSSATGPPQPQPVVQSSAPGHPQLQPAMQFTAQRPPQPQQALQFTAQRPPQPQPAPQFRAPWPPQPQPGLQFRAPWPPQPQPAPQFIAPWPVTSAVRGLRSNSRRRQAPLRPTRAVPIPAQPKVASFPTSSIPGRNDCEYRNKSREDTVWMIHGRKVRIPNSGSTSLYALCRSWLRNGVTQEYSQVNFEDGTEEPFVLPRPLPPLPEGELSEKIESEDKAEDTQKEAR